MQPSVMTLVLLAPKQAISSEITRVATSESTQVSKVTVKAATILVPSEFTQASIVAQLQKDSILPAPSNSDWTEPSWLSYSDATPTEISVAASTETTVAEPTSKPSNWNTNPKDDKIHVVIFFGVTGGLFGLMVSLGLLGSCVRVHQRRARAKKVSGSSSNNQTKNVERTAGLSSTLKGDANNSSRTLVAGKVAQPGGVVIMMPEFPAPAYRTNIPPQDVHYPQGETAPQAPQGSASTRPTNS